MIIDFLDLPKQDTHCEVYFHNPTLPQDAQLSPLKHDLDGYAEQIKPLFESFQWKDIPLIIDIAAQSLKEFPDLSIEERRVYAVYILGKVLKKENFNLPPDFPLTLDEIALAFAHLVIFESILDFLPSSYQPEFTNELMIEYSADVLDTDNPLDWMDFIKIVQSGIVFANQFDSSHLNEKKEIAKKFVEYNLDKIDTYYLPKSFNKHYFTQMSSGSIDMIMNQLLILEVR